MDAKKILWMDLRIYRDRVSACRSLSRDWKLSLTRNSQRLDVEIRKTVPSLLCFEYDYPDTCGLSALRRARSLFPAIPVIMLTEQHSEALAIWALRYHLWDYFVKPIAEEALLYSASSILTQQPSAGFGSVQHAALSNPIPTEVRFSSSQKTRTYPAQRYIETHYHEKISEEIVAELCGMNTSTFSRYFKKEHKTNFRDYLNDYRMGKARELLLNPSARVTDVACTVGFQDPSYFTRKFRLTTGLSPSLYRATYKLQ